MSDKNQITYLHTAYASPRHDAEAERAAIEDRLGVEVRVARTQAESAALIGTTEIAVSTARGLPEPLFERADRLGWVQCLSSGVDGFRLDRLREAGIVLTNGAGVNTEPVAEHAFAFLLGLERRLHRGVRQQATRTWERFEGGELLGKTLGLVGVGAIGGRIAEIASAFDMRVFGVKRDPTTAPEDVDEVVGPGRLDEMLVEADYVVIACPLTEETRGMIGAAELETMRQSALLVNVARGPIVDHDALVEALQLHAVAGAGLDVYPEEPFPEESPLWGLSNAVLTPHMAGSTPRKPERVAEVIAENYRAYTAGEVESMPTRVV